MNGRRSKTNQRRRNRIYRQALGFESLESRQLMSLSSPLVSTVWNIRGDTDTAHPKESIQVTYNADTDLLELTINDVLVESRSPKAIRSIQIFGRRGDDTITVDTGEKSIRAILYGGAGKDTLIGSNHLNILHGGKGNDTLRGGAGRNQLFGEQGDDTLIGGSGKNRIIGGLGRDKLYAAPRRDFIAKDPDDSTVDTEYPEPPHYDFTDPGAAGTLPSVEISEELRQRLIDEAVEQYKNLLGQPYGKYLAYILATNTITTSTLATDTVTTDHSNTNTQEQGVDEADLVETDGNYLYVLSRSQLTIVDVHDPINAHVISTTQLEGWGEGLYLVGSRVVVLMENRDFTPLPGAPNPNLLITYVWDPTGRYSRPSRPQTVAWTFDVADPASPELVEKTTFSGRLASSRMIDDQLYLVINNRVDLPAPVTVPPDESPAEDATGENPSNGYIKLFATEQRYQTEEEYRQWLSENLDAYLPRYVSKLGDGTVASTGALLANIQYAPDGTTLAFTNITNVVNLDVADETPGPANTVTIIGRADSVYASEHNLYIFNSSWSGTTTTNIFKFHLDPHDVRFDASGKVLGSLLNSYAVDEYHGRLRIVTETGWSGARKHTLYVLRETGDELSVTGTLENLGNGESLRSVLFIDDRAYIVTFMEIIVRDPLFTIDLSDPDHPVLQGQVELPGFSSYLHAVDRDHLIGVGQGPRGGTVQVTLFDVGDPTHPAIVDQQVYELSPGWVGSAAAFDPHAFAYFAEEGILAIPAISNSWLSTPTVFDLKLLKVDPATGFSNLGTITHNSIVTRTVRVGEFLYSLAEDDLKIVAVSDPSNVLAQVSLPEPPPSNEPFYPIDLGPITVRGGPITIQPLPISLQPITISSSLTLQTGTLNISET